MAHAHDERYERAKEYVEVMQQAWTQTEVLAASEFADAAKEEADKENKLYQGKYYQFNRPVSSL